MGAKEVRVTAQTIQVLGAMVSCLSEEVSGAEIGRVTKLKSGTLYPILLRLEQAKWLESRWEADDPRELGRPRRRLYRLTGLGAKKANKALAEVRAAIGGFVWA
jgi:PadR family transcriptional regulator PadR